MNHQNTRRKKQKLTPEAQFRATLDLCSRTKDLSAAVSLYESSASPTLTLNNLNSFLYICSNSLSNPETRDSAINFGFNLFHHHNKENFKPNEATLTAMARLAAAKGHGDYAFELAKSVKNYAVAPKLRTYAPALICFCGSGEADKAYEVEEHVKSVGLHLEEPELAALLKVRAFSWCEFLRSPIFYDCIVDSGYVLNSREQLDDVVKEVHKSSKKWPLVVLHKKRIRSLLEDVSKRKLIEEWTDQGLLYGTPYGSNDDWYWLYAAVKLKCLLVTNDEMRDHIFELLGSNFFFRWKERHQVRYTFMKGNLKLTMPPSYSLVIQVVICAFVNTSTEIR
ncbi:UNVERIFIED_CONTAM: Proteinaceous RNase P 2 [Sesamum radiatum]|uniref:ribonuclease P n=1 Tax=Sesamum radiatum TaxID=300843 RepID=A0AAW2UKR5_SESRA